MYGTCRHARNYNGHYNPMRPLPLNMRRRAYGTFLIIAACLASAPASHAGSGVSVAVSRDQHSALVSATVTRPFDATAVNAAVASVGAAHRGVSAIVVDPTSGGGNDLHRAE